MIETLFWGIIAPPKCGKTTLGEMAEKALAEISLKAAIVNYSDAMYEMLAVARHLRERVQENPRPECQKISRGLRHEDSFGAAFWGDEVLFRAREAAHDAALVTLAGMRRKEEFDIVRRLPNNHLTYLTAPTEKRLELTNIKRAREGKAPMTLEQFKIEDVDECEIHIAEIGELADSTIVNDGALDRLDRWTRLFLRDRCGFPVRI